MSTCPLELHCYAWRAPIPMRTRDGRGAPQGASASLADLQLRLAAHRWGIWARRSSTLVRNDPCELEDVVEHGERAGISSRDCETTETSAKTGRNVPRARTAPPKRRPTQSRRKEQHRAITGKHFGVEVSKQVRVPVAEPMRAENHHDVKRRDIASTAS